MSDGIPESVLQSVSDITGIDIQKITVTKTMGPAPEEWLLTDRHGIRLATVTRCPHVLEVLVFKEGNSA